MAHPEQAKTTKKRGNPNIAMLGAVTRWKKGQSGNSRGSLGENAIREALRKFYGENAREFTKYLLAAHRKASGSKPNPKFWELIAERIDGKVPSQVELTGTITHTITELDKKNAMNAIESIRAFESASECPLIGELVGETAEKARE
jgi:hypothetical protein